EIRKRDRKFLLTHGCDFKKTTHTGQRLSQIMGYGIYQRAPRRLESRLFRGSRCGLRSDLAGALRFNGKRRYFSETSHHRRFTANPVSNSADGMQNRLPTLAFDLLPQVIDVNVNQITI